MKAKKTDIYINRKFDATLVSWKSRDNRLPLIVEGARQIGKSECVTHFAEGRYSSFVEINFVEHPEFKGVVRDGYSVENIVRNISQINPGLRFMAGDTLIFFDEIQEFPDIATSLKFFAQDGRFDVICSGSLLGINVRRIRSLSVGYQEQEKMFSLDFEEFLKAKGYSDHHLEDVYQHILDARPLNEAVANAYARLFLDYCALGGMPEVVANYVSRGTFEQTTSIQRRIVSDYRTDIQKYSEGLDPVRIVSVFDAIAPQLAKENKKFQLSKVEHGARRKDYWGCVEWLVQAGIVNLCNRLDFPELPVAAHIDGECYKMYMGDTGLLVAMLDRESQEDVRIRRNLGTWKGGLFENIVGEALVKAGERLVYYKRDSSPLEMDFFLRSGDDLVPIEVKAENVRGKSLRTLIDSEHYPEIRWGVKVVNGNIGFDRGVLTVPQWCAFLLPRLVHDFGNRMRQKR